MTNEERKALMDAMLYGIGATKNGQHILYEDLYLSPAEAERKALVARLRHTVCHGSLGCERLGVDDQAAEQIEADGKRIAELEAEVKSLMDELAYHGVYPNPIAPGETK